MPQPITIQLARYQRIAATVPPSGDLFVPSDRSTVDTQRDESDKSSRFDTGRSLDVVLIRLNLIEFVLFRFNGSEFVFHFSVVGAVTGALVTR